MMSRHDVATARSEYGQLRGVVGWLPARRPSQVARARTFDLAGPVRRTVNSTVVGARDRVDVLVPRGGGCDELCCGLDA